jgi:O-antigen/teichoic acid export membrane protein
MFLFRSTAMAYQEVAVSLLKREGQERQLYRFARGLAAALGAGFLLVSITPLGGIWFRGVSGLSPDLAPLAIGSALLIVPVPFFSAFVSWYRGYLIYRRKTDAIAKAVMINTAALVLIMVLGPRLSFLNGAQVASAAFSLSLVAETLYLRCRVRVYSK